LSLKRFIDAGYNSILLKKLSIKSESSGGFFWKLFPVQRERREQHQLIVN
jgi:hypothetical protein